MQDTSESLPLSAKDEVSSILSKLPDESTLEDIQYHFAEGAVSHEDAKERLGKWLAG